MRRPLDRRQLVAGIISATAAAMLALGSLAAGAFAAPDPGPTLTHPGTGEGETITDGPQTANIPVLAWNGEQVRLVACDRNIGPAYWDSYDEGRIETANYTTEEWTGDQYQKPEPDGADAANFEGGIFNPGSAAFFEPTSYLEHSGMGCVQADYKSVKPGLVRIKLNVYAVNPEHNNKYLVYAKQFLVIWMTVNKPTISEAGTTATGSDVFQKQLNTEGKDNLAGYLGDPEGNGVFKPTPFVETPEEDLGLIQVKVTGDFPVEDPDMAAYLGESPTTHSDTEWQLPGDWPTLAEKLAESSELPNEVKPPVSGDHEKNSKYLWDIHGTPGEVNGEEETAVDPTGEESLVCTSGTVGPYSSTDNCNGSETGSSWYEQSYSRVYGDLTSTDPFCVFNCYDEGTVGPFDPLAANESLLSDGRLTPDDAPMPAMQINVAIAEHEAGGIGGVGELGEVSKALIYSHSFNADAYTKHNLYNPYYSEWIPSVNRWVAGNYEASGVDGVEGSHDYNMGSGDFTGFLNYPYEPYEFWSNVQTTSSNVGTATNCLFRTWGDEPSTGEGSYYNTPSGTTGETFYTDERGELYLAYSPGDGFYFENLPKIKRSADNECDLQAYLGETIGTSSITATPVYPYQGISFRPEPSDPLVKEVKSQWRRRSSISRRAKKQASIPPPASSWRRPRTSMGTGSPTRSSASPPRVRAKSVGSPARSMDSISTGPGRWRRLLDWDRVTCVSRRTATATRR